MGLPVTLSCEDGQWSASVTIGDDVTVVPLFPFGDRLGGTAPQEGDGSKRVRVDVANPCPPAEELVAYQAERGNSGCNFTLFAIGQPVICTDDVTMGGCADIARFKVELRPCAERLARQYVVQSNACCTSAPPMDYPGVMCVKFPDLTTKLLYFLGAGTWEVELDAGRFLTYSMCAGFPGTAASLSITFGGHFPAQSLAGSDGLGCWPGDAVHNFLNVLTGGVYGDIGEYLVYPFDDIFGCGGPFGILTPASTYRIPRSLTLHKLTGCSGFSSDLDMVNHGADHGGPGGYNWWNEMACAAPTTRRIDLYCSLGGVWTVSVTPATGVAHVTAVSYNPFLLEFSLTEGGNACCPSTGGTATFTIHE